MLWIGVLEKVLRTEQAAVVLIIFVPASVSFGFSLQY